MKRLPEERQYLVIDNINMVHDILQRKFHRRDLSSDIYQDLFQEGCVWLTYSAILYEESYGYAFSTYAYPTITGGIQRYFRDKMKLIRPPRRLNDINSLVLTCLDLGMTVEEISEEHGIDPKDIESVVNLNSIRSIDSPVTLHNGDEGSYQDILSDNKNDINEMLEEMMSLSIIEEVLSRIKDKKHRDIYEEYLYSCLYDEKPKQQYLAEKYGVSQGHINRILHRYNELYQSIHSKCEKECE